MEQNLLTESAHYDKWNVKDYIFVLAVRVDRLIIPAGLAVPQTLIVGKLRFDIIARLLPNLGL